MAVQFQAPSDRYEFLTFQSEQMQLFQSQVSLRSPRFEEYPPLFQLEYFQRQFLPTEDLL